MMKLTTEEQSMLEGRCGYPVQKSMEILVALGEAYDAEPVRAYAERMGYRSALEKSGVKIVCETCPAIAPADEIASRLGKIWVMATNSAKLAHYIPSEWGIKSLYGSTQACVEAAVSGKWR